MSDRICLMNDGSIAQLGTPSEIYFHPRSVFAAEFVGHANFVVPASDRTNGKCMVRPENIRILGEGEKADMVVDAILEDTIMLGAFSRHVARLVTGERLVAVNRSDEKGAPHHPGETVRLGWDACNTVHLGAEAGR